MNSSSFAAQLKNIIANGIHSPCMSVTKTEVLQKGLILFGAGAHGELVVTSLMSQGVRPAYFVDKNEIKAGKEVCGIPVRPLSALFEKGDAFVLLSSSHIKSMINDCKKYNVNSWILPGAIRDWCFVLGDLGFCSLLSEFDQDVVSAFSLFADEKSQEIYSDFIRYHYTFETDLSEHYDPDQYFPNDLKSTIDYSGFVDAGAYNGDTFQSWLRNYIPKDHSDSFAYYAYEPGREQFEVLSQTIDRFASDLKQNIFLYNVGLGAQSEYLSMVGTGPASRLSEKKVGAKTDSCIKIECLDDTIFSGKKPTIIKADIEGFEIPFLEGAKQTIDKHRPTLAISVYHRYNDIWKIPHWIHNLNCGYSLYLRHHSPVYGDTVCYAIPTGS